MKSLIEQAHCFNLTFIIKILKYKTMWKKYTYDQSSNSNERTLDKCVPKFLWIPEHSIQIRAPWFKLAQTGSKF